MKAVSHLSWPMFLPSQSSLNFSTSGPRTRSTTDFSYLKAPAAVCSEVRANNLSMSVFRVGILTLFLVAEQSSSYSSSSSLLDEVDIDLDSRDSPKADSKP